MTKQISTLGQGSGSFASTPLTDSPAVTGQGSGVCTFCGDSYSQETMIECAKCRKVAHTVCFEVPEGIALDKIKSYKWECNGCKVCMVCADPRDESLVLLCDECDRGCHTYCATPKLDSLPSGHWACSVCAASSKSS